MFFATSKRELALKSNVLVLHVHIALRMVRLLESEKGYSPLLESRDPGIPKGNARDPRGPRDSKKRTLQKGCWGSRSHFPMEAVVSHGKWDLLLRREG